MRVRVLADGQFAFCIFQSSIILRSLTKGVPSPELAGARSTPPELRSGGEDFWGSLFLVGGSWFGGGWGNGYWRIEIAKWGEDVGCGHFAFFIFQSSISLRSLS